MKRNSKLLNKGVPAIPMKKGQISMPIKAANEVNMEKNEDVKKERQLTIQTKTNKESNWKKKSKNVQRTKKIQQERGVHHTPRT